NQIQNSLPPITNSVWCSGEKSSLPRHARVMRRPWHSPPTSSMRTGTLRFCATCILGITHARWSITMRTAGSFRTTPKSSSGLPTFVTTQKNRRSGDGKDHSLDFAWGPCPHTGGCACAASSAGEGGSSTGTDRKVARQDTRGKRGGGKETDR